MHSIISSSSKVECGYEWLNCVFVKAPGDWMTFRVAHRAVMLEFAVETVGAIPVLLVVQQAMVRVRTLLLWWR